MHGKCCAGPRPKLDSTRQHACLRLCLQQGVDVRLCEGQRPESYRGEVQQLLQCGCRPVACTDVQVMSLHGRRMGALQAQPLTCISQQDVKVGVTQLLQCCLILEDGHGAQIPVSS